MDKFNATFKIIRYRIDDADYDVNDDFDRIEQDNTDCSDTTNNSNHNNRNDT